MNLFIARPKIRNIEGGIIGGLTSEQVDCSCMRVSNLPEAMGFDTVTNIVSSEERLILQNFTTVKVVAWFITDSAM